MGEWIEHDGKSMPVDGEAIVDVIFRDGDTCEGDPANIWARGRDWWLHEGGIISGHGADIVKYRLSA